MAGFKLNPSCPFDTEIARVFRQKLNDAIDAASARHRPKRERIHDARTSCKKARALLKIVRSRNATWYRRENRCLSDAARRLSALRDADTLLDNFVGLREKS